MNPAACLSRSMEFWNPTNLSNRYAHNTAPTVLPTAVATVK